MAHMSLNPEHGFNDQTEPNRTEPCGWQIIQPSTKFPYFALFKIDIVFCVCSLLQNLGASRGFAFVEFSTEEEATRWMEYKQVSLYLAQFKPNKTTNIIRISHSRNRDWTDFSQSLSLSTITLHMGPSHNWICLPIDWPSHAQIHSNAFQDHRKCVKLSIVNFDFESKFDLFGSSIRIYSKIRECKSTALKFSETNERTATERFWCWSSKPNSIPKFNQKPTFVWHPLEFDAPPTTTKIVFVFGHFYFNIFFTCKFR